jgi:Lar family restriction alleviation protein
MTNEEKYKTAEERHIAYAKYCESMRSRNLPIMHDNFEWLALEYDKALDAELKPCPFCGEVAKQRKVNDMHFVYCVNCAARTVGSVVEDDAIAAWNRRVK